MYVPTSGDSTIIGDITERKRSIAKEEKEMNIPKVFFLALGALVIALVIVVPVLFLIERDPNDGRTLKGEDALHYVTPVPGGEVLYVSPAGKDSNDGSQAYPFATLQKAADVVTPGTIVHVLPGTYTEVVTVETDGTANARITFVSEQKWEAKISTPNDDTPWTTKADYIDIIGFDISSEGARDGIVNLGSYTRTVGNRVHDIPGVCDTIGGSGITDGNYTAHDNDIIGNVVFNIGETYPQMCQYVHAIYHSNARGQIVNNIAYNNAGVGINLWHAATDTVVSNNLVFNNKEHGISIGTNKSDNDDEEGDNFLVTNNISINNALLGIRERKGVGSHNQFVNNIVYGNGEAAFGDEDYEWPSAAGSKDVGTIAQLVQFVSFREPAPQPGPSLEVADADGEGVAQKKENDTHQETTPS
jgi:hypothetical protein